MSGTLGHHGRKYGTVTEKGAGKIDTDDGFPLVDGSCSGRVGHDSVRSSLFADACADDQEIDTSELFQRPVCHRTHVIFTADVECESKVWWSQLRLRHRVQSRKRCLQILSITTDNAQSIACISERGANGAADTATAAGYYRDSVQLTDTGLVLHPP
jgi:hypothetical protein